MTNSRFKFAPCECDESNEEWERTGVIHYTKDGEGVDMVEYECQTCGTVEAVTVPAKRV